MALTTEIEKKADGAYIVHLAGRLDTDSAPACEKAMQPLLDEPARKLLLDMKKLDYISSIGLRIVLKAQKAAKAVGGKVVISGMQPQIAKVFKLAGIMAHTEIFDSVESADIYLDAIQRKETMKNVDFDLA